MWLLAFSYFNIFQNVKRKSKANTCFGFALPRNFTLFHFRHINKSLSRSHHFHFIGETFIIFSIPRKKNHFFSSSERINNSFPIFDCVFEADTRQSHQRTKRSVHFGFGFTLLVNIIIDWKSKELGNKMAERSALWLDTMSLSSNISHIPHLSFYFYTYIPTHTRHTCGARTHPFSHPRIHVCWYMKCEGVTC